MGKQRYDFYRDNILDEFELNFKTENEIVFTLIGHYAAQWPPEQRDGESAEDWNQRQENGYDYTLEFPIKLVKTQDCWRFYEFHSALADQKWPEEQ